MHVKIAFTFISP